MFLDWSKCPAVESVPGKVSGAWVFRGTRMPVAAVLDGLTREQIKAALDFAAPSLEVHPPDLRARWDKIRNAQKARYT